MPDYVKRMLDEKEALVEKLNKLKTFLSNKENLKQLDSIQQANMVTQSDIMKSYVDILEARIEYDSNKAQ